MANGRITWQSVAAPDFSGAADSMEVAGSLWGEAFAGLGNVGRDIRGREMSEAGRAAQSRAMEIMSAAGGGDAGVKALQGAMANGGFGALGVNQNDLTEDSMANIRGLQDNFLNRDKTRNEMERNNVMNQGTLSTIATQEQLREQQEAKFEREQNVLNPRTDAAYARQQEELALLDAATELNKKATVDVATLADSTQFKSKEEVRRFVLNKNFDPATEAAYLRAVDGIDDAHWQAAPEHLEEIKNNPTVVEVDRSLTRMSERLDLAASTDNVVRAYTEAYAKYEGIDDPIQDVAQRLTAENKDGDSTVTNWIGTINDEGKALAKSTGLPEEVVASVIETTLKSTLFGNQKIDWETVNKRLEAIKGAGDIATVQSKISANERNQEALASVKTDLSKAYNKWALAKTRNDSAGQEAALAEIEKARNKASTLIEQYATKSEAEAKEAAITPEARAVTDQMERLLKEYPGSVMPGSNIPIPTPTEPYLDSQPVLRNADPVSGWMDRQLGRPIIDQDRKVARLDKKYPLDKKEAEALARALAQEQAREEAAQLARNEKQAKVRKTLAGPEADAYFKAMGIRNLEGR